MVQVVKKAASKRAAIRPAAGAKGSKAGTRHDRGAPELHSLPGVAAILVEGRRKDLEALTQAGKQSLLHAQIHG